MLSPQLRKKVHELWTRFWSAGMTNPLVAIEQITYLLFIRQLEQLDAERVKANKSSIYKPRPLIDGGKNMPLEQCRWSFIRQKPSFELLNDIVFPWLRGLEQWLAQSSGVGAEDRLRAVSGRLDDAYFVLDRNKPETLARAIALIDDLFKAIEQRSVNSDIMGDIFEHLLDEIDTAGKNGQFRTPRQITRFMVAVLDPDLTDSVLDPASGTGGFLMNTLLHWRTRHTAPDVLRLEWDGTPHNLLPFYPKGKRPAFTDQLWGFDNDRTMVRIAWMNLLLHDLEFPAVRQLDGLSKRLDELQGLTAAPSDPKKKPDRVPREFKKILANPPFTGTVDEGDLSKTIGRFPRGAKDKALTDKSELLFVWLIRDLLTQGGRAAVIVPDGVLFGNTIAHKRLRRQLLFENVLEGVISLPGNVFQPYSGVKTSILIFQKNGVPISPGEDPRTREVWFYEVSDEAYTLDQKRNGRPGKDNDLWDAQEKFAKWRAYLDAVAEGKPAKETAPLREAAVSKETYYQPDYWQERWTTVDQEFLKRFPEQKGNAGQTLPLHELWPGMARDPEAATAEITKRMSAVLQRPLYEYCWTSAVTALFAAKKPTREIADAAAEKAARDALTFINRLVRDEALLDREFDQFGFNALRTAFDSVRENAVSTAAASAKLRKSPLKKKQTLEDHADHFRGIILWFARLDGYNVWRRGNENLPRPGKETADGTRQPVPLSWTVAVRVWAQRETWGLDPKTAQEITEPTHTAAGQLREDYFRWLRDTLQVFDDDGTVKPEHLDRLDPDCLEALDFNLSAGRHKPFTFDAGIHRPPAELIGELQSIHSEIQERLIRLKGMVQTSSAPTTRHAAGSKRKIIRRTK